MEKIVVTGGAGFIGSHIVEELVEQGKQVIVVDNLHTGNINNIANFINNKQIEFINADIMQEEALLSAFTNASTVFHLAALISVPESMEKPEGYISINSIGTLKVLQACKITGVKNLVLSSSAAIYGNNPIMPKQEAMLPEPLSPYAVSKLDGEYYCDMYAKTYGINAKSLRYFNVFGPRQDPNSQYAAAIPIFISKAINNESISIYGDGEQTRDFIYVKDIVQANLLAAKSNATGAFNAAWNKKISINALAAKIIDITGSKSNIEYLLERPGDIKHSIADNTKIIESLNFKVGTSLDSALVETIKYFQGIK